MGDYPLPKVRAACLALPEVTERVNGRHAAYLVRGKTFLYFVDDHHGDGRLALHCKTVPEMRELLIGSDPACYHVPPYLGPRGWIGVYLDVPTDWDEVDALIAESYRLIAPKRLAALVERSPGSAGNVGD